MAEFASKSLAGTALGFALGGTVLALMNNSCGGGPIGGLLGGGNRGNCDPLETKEASCLRQQVATLQAERYADAVGISTFKDTLALHNKQSENLATALQALAAQDKEIGVLKTDIRCLTTVNDLGHNALSESFKSGLALESERRACGDERIVSWADSTFIRGRLVLPSTPTITGFSNGCCNNNVPVVSATGKDATEK